MWRCGFNAGWPWPNGTQMTGPVQRTYTSGSTVTMKTYVFIFF